MSEQIRIAHPGRTLQTAKTSITYAEKRELQRLFDQAADSCDAAALVFEEDGTGPSGSELQRIRMLAARVVAMVDRISAILGLGLERDPAHSFQHLDTTP